MKYSLLVSNKGITLLEVMVAISIFAVVIGITATSLGSFYVSMDVQKERIAAVQSCRSVMSAIREKRTEFVLPNDEIDRQGLLQWVQEMNEEGWQDFLHSGDAGLHGHEIVVLCQNMEGGPASPEDNPIRVQVRATWNDLRGRPMAAQVITVLADQ